MATHGDALTRLSAALADRYRVEREIGAGGMATVYLAEDIKHHRKIAIKVLREDLAASLGSSRFLREIEIAAQLQHPHILPLLDSGESEGFLFYVMPYVTGHSLRERLEREGELPVHEAVRLMVEVVDALAFAHEHGVIHRDMKPDNVMLSGRHALVADFGVAKAVSEATGRNALTTIGVALGTPAYMSPEQAMADTHIDQRSDIYALGAMLYELLCGRPPFIGTTPQQVLAAHVNRMPDPVSQHRPGVSPQLEHVIMKCLEKRAADRYQNAAEMLADLEPLATPSGGMTPTHTRPVPAAARRAPATGRVAAGIAAVALLAVAAFALVNAGAGSPNVTVGTQVHLTTDNGLEMFPAISPDGKFVAYVARPGENYRVFVRPVGSTRAIALTDDSTGVQSQPRFSPDGSRVLFLWRGGVFAAPTLGGPAQPVVPATAAAPIASAAWGPGGHEIAFVRQDSLYIAPHGGGAARPIGTASTLRACAWWPSRAYVACASGNPDYWNITAATFQNVGSSRIVTFRVSDGLMHTVGDSVALNQSPAWADDGGRLYYVSNLRGARDVFAVNMRDGRARGDAARVTAGANAQNASISADGKYLTYAEYTDESNIFSIPAGATSAVRPARLTTGSQVIDAMFVSTDGKWLVYSSDILGNYDQYRIPIDGGTPEPLTSDTPDECCGMLSPDGTEFAFHSYRTGVRELFVKPLNGVAHMIPGIPGVSKAWPSWTPDGNGIVWDWEAGGPTRAGLVRRDANGAWGAPRTIALQFRRPQVTPDGKTVIGERGASIVSTPIDSGPVTVLYRGGENGRPDAVRPRISLDGKTIEFRGAVGAEGKATFWSIPVAGGTPKLVAEFIDPARPSFRPDWTTDGKRFFFAINNRQSDVWVVELQER